MEVQGVKYTISADYKDLEKAQRRVGDLFGNIGKEAAKSGRSLDDAFKKAAKSAASMSDDFASIGEQIDFQKQIIRDLEAEVSKLEKALKSAVPGTEWSNISKELQNVRRELAGEYKGLEELERQAEATDNAHVSFRQQLQQVREQLIAMEAAGKRGTKEYRELQQEAGRLRDAMADAQKQMAVLAHDQRGFQGVINGLQGLSGAMSAAMGVVGMFTDENEEMQKVMLKVQSLMSITIGLQQMQATLDKDSAFRLVTLNGLKEWWAKVTAQAAAAQTAENAAVTAGGVAATGTAGAFRLLGAAIKSVPGVGWLLTAVAVLGTIASLVVKRINKEKELTGELQRQKRALEEIEDAKNAALKSTEKEVSELQSAVDRLGNLKKGSHEYKTTLGQIADTIGLQKDYIEKNIDAVKRLTEQWIKAKKAQALGDEYLTRATNVKVDTEDVISRVGRMQKSQKKEAKEALRTLGLLSEDEIDSYLDRLWNKVEHAKNEKARQSNLTYWDLFEMAENDLRKKAKAQADIFYGEYEKEMQNYTRAGLTIDNAKSDSDRQESAKKAYEDRKAAIDAAKKAIEEGTKELADYEKKMQLEIRQANIDAMEEGAEKELEQIRLDYEKQIEYITELRQKLLDENKKIAQAQATASGVAFNEENVALTAEQNKMIVTMAQQAQQAMANSINKVNRAQRDGYKELLREYGDYRQKVEDINEKYQAQLAVAGNNQELVAKITEAWNKELEELKKDIEGVTEEVKKFASVIGSFNGEMSEDFYSKLKELRKSLKGSSDEDDVVKYNAVTAAIDKYGDAIDRLEIAYENLTDAQNAFNESASDLNFANLEKAAMEYQNVLQEFAAENADIFSQWFSAVKGINKIIQEDGFLHDNQKEAINDTIESFDALLRGFQSGGPMGAVMALITDVFPKIAKWIEKIKNESKEALKSEIEQIQKLHDAQQKITSFWSSVYNSGNGSMYFEGFGSGAWSEYISSMDAEITMIQDSIGKLKQLGTDAAEELQDAYIELANVIQEKYDAILAHAESSIQTTASEIESGVFGLFNQYGIQSGNFTEYIQSLFVDAFRNYAQEYLIASNVWNASDVTDYQQYFDSMITHLQELIGQYVNMIAWYDLDDEEDQQALNSLVNQISTLIGANENGMFSYPEFFQGISDQVDEWTQQLGDLLGIDFSQFDNSATATAKGIAQASQESIDELNGRFTVIQSHTAQLLENSSMMSADIDTIRFIVDNISEDTSAIRSMMSDVAGNVQYIRNNM